MNKNIRGLILETVGEVLLEGRLEDVKSKYPEEKAGDIDRLSQGDPSGNNKYLAWMANQLITVGEHNHENIISIIGRYHKELPRINTKLSKEVVDANPDLYPGRETRRVSNNPKDIMSYGTVESLTKVIEASEENVPVSTERDKIYQDDKWTVIVPKTHKASCKYGVHSGWCVSVDNDHYFKSYTSDGMLAFVLWRGKQEGQMEMGREGEYKVAVNVKYDRPEYSRWEWWNKKDTQMDNDLPLSVFPPALIEAIKGTVRTQMKNSGYLMEINVDELKEKSHILIEDTRREGEHKYIFIPKKEYGLDWVKAYDRRDRMYSLRGNTNNFFGENLPIFSVQEPRGHMEDLSIDLVHMYRSLTQADYWNRNRTKLERFKNALPYDLRRGSGLSEEKTTELWEYFKTYFTENFAGYLNVHTPDLAIGDEVKWKRKPARLQRQLGHKIGKIVRQTPSGMFVVDVWGEDKPSRFKPTDGKYMDKKFSSENLNADDLFTDLPQGERD
jgi:hypothetical protein